MISNPSHALDAGLRLSFVRLSLTRASDAQRYALQPSGVTL